MKRRINKELICFFILVPVFVYASFYISSRIKNNLPNYSVLNRSEYGCSVFYQLLKELDYPVERTLQPINSAGQNNIQIVADDYFGNFNPDHSEVKEWVSKGGILLYLTPGNIYYDFYDQSKEINSDIKIVKEEAGLIILADVNSITNDRLSRGTDNAYQLFTEINSYRYNKLYFNERHLFVTDRQLTIWGFIPMEIKYCLYQIFIILAAFFYYKGKRFGKPLPLYEETERTENEFLYSAASLYKQADCWDLMLENYYNDFLQETSCSVDKWLEYWQKEGLPHLNEAKQVYNFMHQPPVKLKEKEVVQVVNTIEKLKEISRKRREEYWKILKKTE